MKKPIVQSVPNFSEGRNLSVVEKITAPFAHTQDVRLLDVQTDADHNRCVVTVLGSPQAVRTAMLASIAQAVALIDMNRHTGQHPRMGAVDVVPFIPVREMTMDQAVELARQVADEAAQTLGLPIFLYERAAQSPPRSSLPAIRKGEFEGMSQKLKDPKWRPDYGPDRIHPTAGVTAVGARAPLVAFNVNLNTNNQAIADAIAKRVRHIGGGLRYCKAMGVSLEDRGIVQVSMNMTDYRQSALYQALELIRIEARRYGVAVVGSEVVGMLPLQALADCAAYYMGIEDFDMGQILETHLM